MLEEHLNIKGLICSLTGDPIHPGGVPGPHVIPDQFQDVPQHGVHLVSGDRGQMVAILSDDVIGTLLPPERQVATEHGQGDLYDVRSLVVVSSRLGQALDLRNNLLQRWEGLGQLVHHLSKQYANMSLCV